MKIHAHCLWLENWSGMGWEKKGEWKPDWDCWTQTTELYIIKEIFKGTKKKKSSRAKNIQTLNWGWSLFKTLNVVDAIDDDDEDIFLNSTSFCWVGCLWKIYYIYFV